MMKRLITLVLAIVLALACGASAAAVEFDLNVEYGFFLNQYILGDSDPMDSDANLVYGISGDVRLGAFLVGGDFSYRGLEYGPTSLEIRSFSAFGGIRVINADAFKLYALAGYAGLDTYHDLWFYELTSTVSAGGLAVGAQAELNFGRLMLSGKFLTTVGADATWVFESSMIPSYEEDYYAAALIQTDLRCTYMIDDMFGIFGGFNYASADLDGYGELGHGSWWTAGVNVSF